MSVTIEIADAANDELVAALARLIPQLSKSAPELTHDVLAKVIACDANTVFVARDADDQVVGTLTLVVFPLPTGMRAWIEDVVVDAEARGLGAGAALTDAALGRAAELGARTVDLTSRPSREAANRLYQRAGFQVRTTNVYRYQHPEADSSS